MRWAAALAAVLLLMVFGTDIVLHRATVPEATTMDKSMPATVDRFSEAPAADPATSPSPGDEATPAIAELGLALLAVWLLAISIALPRLYWLRGRRGG
jgi:hypothetical protein